MDPIGGPIIVEIIYCNTIGKFHFKGAKTGFV
jgi:hypothetical protein